jgi:hypothetical protein
MEDFKVFPEDIQWNPETGEIIETPQSDYPEQLGRAYMNHSFFGDLLDAELERLKARKAANEVRKDKLKLELDRVIPEGANLKRPELGFTIYRSKSESVRVVDESAIPADYWRVKTERALDKNMVKQQLKDGLDVNGCELDVKDNLIIKRT